MKKQYKNHNNKSIKKARFLSVILVLLITHSWCEAQYFFQEMAPIDISNGGVIKPNWIVKGDFNNDNHLDFAVTNGGKDTVSVYLANGLGTGFLKPKDYTTRMFSSGKWVGGGNPRFFTIAHFQNADITDLVTANFESSDISILLGDGVGGFKSATTYKVGPSPWSVAVGNFDNDHRMDVAVANTGLDKLYNWDCTNYITILWNYDNGIFTGSTKEFVGDAPKSIIAADFDGNGKDELAVANAIPGTVSILEPIIQQGSTTSFQTTQTLFVGSKSLPFYVIYKEDWKELFVANYLEDRVDVYKNNNDSFSLIHNFRVGLGSYCIDFADFDGDKAQDMVVLNMSSDNVAILKGKGNGDFEPAVHYQAGTSPHSAVGGNFNGNKNKADLLVADFTNNRIIQMNDGFFEPKNFAIGSGPIFVASASLNEGGTKQDEFLDLITVNETSNSISILLGDGKGDFTQDIPEMNVGNIPKCLTVGNFDNDGKKDDVAVVNYVDKNVMILLNKNDDGHLSSNGIPIKLHENPTSITTVDFNGKGINQDLVIVAFPYIYVWDVKNNKEIYKYDLGPSDSGLRNMHSSIVAFNFGNAPGLALADCEKVTVWEIKNKNFSKVYEARLKTGNNTKPWFIVNGDFDGDKKEDDLAVADTIGSSIYILLYDNKNQVYESPISVTVGKKPCFITVADFDSDKNMDLAVANEDNQNISLLKGQGNGMFTLMATIETGRGSSSIAIGDFNNNGIKDMVVSYKACFQLKNRNKKCDSTKFSLLCPGKIGFVSIYNQ
jgi:hypothetical protein